MTADLTPQTRAFFAGVMALSRLSTRARYRSLELDEYPFDGALLAHSRLYRHSRSAYLKLGGRYARRNQSTMRALNEADLFDNEISYAPVASELAWLQANHRFMTTRQLVAELEAVEYFNTISVFHEQNHRVVWRLLPPPPTDQLGVSRYLNLAESVVVMLDVAVADEVGQLARACQRVSVLYRGHMPYPGVRSARRRRRYLLSVFYATYCILERIDRSDVIKAVNYVMPGPTVLNRAAVRCAREMNPDFETRTNPQWHARQWEVALARLKALHRHSRPALQLPQDPLDFRPNHLAPVQRVMAAYGL